MKKKIMVTICILIISLLSASIFALSTSNFGNLLVKGDLQFSNTTGALVDSPENTYLRIGDAGNSSRNLAANDDLLVSGKLEVDGVTYLDSAVNMMGEGSISLNDNNYGRLKLRESSQTVDHFAIGLGGLSRSLVITESNDMAIPYQHAQQTHPTVFIQANNGVGNWTGITHNTVEGLITTGNGNLKIASASDIFQIEANDTAVTCNSANAGGIYYNGGENTHYACNVTHWIALY